jgi:hypothetical protein
MKYTHVSHLLISFVRLPLGMKRKHHFAELNPRDQYIPFVMEQSFVDIVRTPINVLLEISHQKLYSHGHIALTLGMLCLFIGIRIRKQIRDRHSPRPSPIFGHNDVE